MNATFRSSRTFLCSAGALALALALAGCAADPALGPHEKMPTAQDAADRLHLDAAAGGGAPLAAAGENAWWTIYRDPDSRAGSSGA